jgi:hypothetical protein
LSKITFFKSSSYPMCQLQSNPRVEFNNHTAGSRREIPHEQHHVFMLKLLAWPFTWCFLEEILVNYDIIWSIVGLVYLAILCTAPLDVLHSTSQIPQDATLSILSSSLVCNRPCGTNRVCITPTQLCTYSDSRLTQPITLTTVYPSITLRSPALKLLPTIINSIFYQAIKIWSSLKLIRFHCISVLQTQHHLTSKTTVGTHKIHSAFILLLALINNRASSSCFCDHSIISLDILQRSRGSVRVDKSPFVLGSSTNVLLHSAFISHREFFGLLCLFARRTTS